MKTFLANPSFVDIFSGSGLAGIGLEQAGLKPLLAVDKEPTCLETLRCNHPFLALDGSDLAKTRVITVLSDHCIKPTFDGLLWMSPPCQGVSECGKKLGWGDPRNTLLFTTVEAATRFPSAWIVMENVPGLLMGEGRPIFDKLFRQLWATGRDVTTWVLSALDWSLSQSRTRVFIICPPPGVPAPPMPVGPWAGKTPKTLREAIHPSTGFVDVDPHPVPLRNNEVVIYSEIPEGGNWEDSWRGRVYAHDVYMRALSRGKVKGKRPWEMPKYRNFLRRLSWDEPGQTFVATWPTNIGFRCHCPHPTELRYLSNGEGRAQQGVPDWYVIAGDVAERRRQIGNGVPPPMSRAVAECLMGISTGGATTSTAKATAGVSTSKKPLGSAAKVDTLDVRENVHA